MESIGKKEREDLTLPSYTFFPQAQTHFFIPDSSAFLTSGAGGWGVKGCGKSMGVPLFPRQILSLLLCRTSPWAAVLQSKPASAWVLPIGCRGLLLRCLEHLLPSFPSPLGPLRAVSDTFPLTCRQDFSLPPPGFPQAWPSPSCLRGSAIP